MHKFHKFILAWNSTCFGRFVFPSSGVYSLYTQQWYILYRFVDSFRTGPGWNQFHPCPARRLYNICIPLLSVQWIDSWWWTDQLSETCRVSCQNKFVKLVHLVGFITGSHVLLEYRSNRISTYRCIKYCLHFQRLTNRSCETYWTTRRRWYSFSNRRNSNATLNYNVACCCTWV